MLANVGLSGFLSDAVASILLSSYSEASLVSSLLGLVLRSREIEDGLTWEDILLLRLALGTARRKIWTVSVAEETQRSVEVELKDMLKIRAGIEPLRN